MLDIVVGKFWNLLSHSALNTLGKSSKKSVFLLSGWPPSLTVSFSWILLVCVWPKIMIICVLKQILHKKVIFNQILESPILPYCLLLLCHKMVGWQYSKGSAQWDKMCFEYHIVIFHRKKWVKIFTFAYSQGRGGWPPTPLRSAWP